MIFYKDKRYMFVEYFNEHNGFLIRSNVIDGGIETDIQPRMRSFPELLDIGIMGTCQSCENGICKAAGVDCYQNAVHKARSNMTLTTYRHIVEQCKGKTFQIALGGAGDPNKHEDFEAILKVTRDNNIVPNYTTSGFDLSQEEVELTQKYCGAVAVSFYSRLNENDEETNPITIDAIHRFVGAGCVTNIHYVVSRDNIEEAIYRLEKSLFPRGINAVVFLLYKPVGLGKNEKMIGGLDDKYKKFIGLATQRKYPFKVGFDTCQTPALKMFGNEIAAESLDFCEAARFSMYIDCEMNAYPCSFGWEMKKFSVNLKGTTILKAWQSKAFESFRQLQEIQCHSCRQTECHNCALGLGINVCGLV